MAKKNRNRIVNPTHIDCACLIHDTLYDWSYVDKLYNSLCRNLTPEVRMHVYTEKHRPVPGHMIHHALEEWPGIKGPKKSWWYKIQLFNPRHHAGPLLYFDLDSVIVGNLDWIWQQPTDKFWAVQDFKILFRPKKTTINSSVMWFDTTKWSKIYQEFDPTQIVANRTNWHGDQDYIHEKITNENYAYLDADKIKSWRWQCLDGGYDFNRRAHLTPGTGTTIDSGTSVLIFHGHPKPHEITDTNISNYWK